MGGHGCECFGNVDALTYAPSRCVLPRWNAREFCSLLAGRRILLVGDSLSEQTATVLMNSIALGYHDAPEQGCQTQVTFGFGDTLVGYKTAKGPKHRGHSWAHYMRLFRPEIAVVSCGPHVRWSEFGGFLDSVIRDHDREFPNTSLVWRSQYGGGCSPTPLQPTADWEAFWANYSLTRPLYNYDKFDTFDRIAEERFPGPNRRFLDFGAVKLRPDWRVGSVPSSPYPRDCTHFCANGPLEDLVPRLFLQLLRDLPPADPGAGLGRRLGGKAAHRPSRFSGGGA